jgi:hypothetical protein
MSRCTPGREDEPLRDAWSNACAYALGEHRGVECRFRATERGSPARPLEMQTEVIQLMHLAIPKRAFGEFLVEQAVLDRFQLLRVLQLQDRVPGTRLGACAVVLGFAPRDTIEQMHARFVDDDLDARDTVSFERDAAIEIGV